MSKRNKQKQSVTGLYIIPAALFISAALAVLVFNYSWWWLMATGIFIFCRWLYYLPAPKRRKEDIASEQQYFVQRKKYKQEYEAKKKILGNENSYQNKEAYWARYNELGMAALEKELMLGNYVPKSTATKKKYTVGNLLYDYFLGTEAVEKKRGFSSTNTQGYTGESTGGQSANDYGGGSSGGGGATN